MFFLLGKHRVQAHSKLYRSIAEFVGTLARRRETNPRFVSLVLSGVFGFVGLFYAWQMIVAFAFSTLIHPDIQGREWWRIVADTLLFNDGTQQFVLVTVFVFVAVFSISMSLLQLSATVKRWPSITFSVAASCIAFGLATAAILGLLLVLRM